MSSVIRSQLICDGPSAYETLESSAAVDDLPLDYWRESILPSVAILVVLPMLAAYEFTAANAAATGLRNSADLWLRSALSTLGLRHVVALPAALIAALCAWQWWGRHPFRCRASTYFGVVAESVCISVLLVLFGNFLCLEIKSATSTHSTWNSLASFLGAGVYEEVFFRLLMLPLSFGVLRLFRVPVNYAWGVAIAANGFLFATAHYLSPNTETFTTTDLLAAANRVAVNPDLWFGWLFRCAAGIAFCLLFVYRGLAVAVGSHVCYDVLVGIVINHWLTAPVS